MGNRAMALWALSDICRDGKSMAARSRIDRFEVIRKLGAGANAKVKLAVDTTSGTLVALKIMKGDTNSIPKRYLGQCQNEIQALNAINHPNIVRIFSVSENTQYLSKSGRSFPALCIAMELMPHGELFDVLFYTGRMEERLTRVYFRQIMEAVSACHAQGITHRDLKPENILFDAEFNLKLADFGFAAPMAGRDGSGLLRTYLGTEVYMAPELLRNQPYSGAAVDVFACGVILFILLSQHPAFGKATANDRYYAMFQRDNGRFWTTHGKSKPVGYYSSAFQDLVNRMLAAEPEDRPTVTEVLQHPWLNGPAFTLAEAQRAVAEKWAAAQAKKTAERRRIVTGQHGYRDLPETAETELTLPTYTNDFEKFSRLFLPHTASEILSLLRKFLSRKSAEVLEIGHKMTAKLSVGDEEVAMSVKLYEAGEFGICVDVTKLTGSAYTFMELFTELRIHFDQTVVADS